VQLPSSVIGSPRDDFRFGFSSGFLGVSLAESQFSLDNEDTSNAS
jgi:hypothetical protein